MKKKKPSLLSNTTHHVAQFYILEIVSWKVDDDDDEIHVQKYVRTLSCTHTHTIVSEGCDERKNRKLLSLA